MKNNYIICVAICLSYVSSSLFGESYYNDDLFRSIFGYYGWQDDGRPLAEFIYRTLTLNNINIPDMYPLLLIIAICFYCYVCIKVGNVILDRKSLLIDIISCSFIFSPLFASNLWFRYDSFFMVLSLTAAIYPFSINKNITSKVLLGAISLISCLTLYQPSISLFICMSSVEFMFISMRADNNMKSMWLVLSSRVATIALSLFIYFKVVIPLVPAGYYFAKLSNPINNIDCGYDIIINNYISVYSLFHKVYDSPFIIPLVGLLILAIISSIACVATANKKVLSALSILICFLTLFVFVPGLGVFTQNMAVYPRVLIAFSCLFFTSLSLIAISPLHNYIKQGAVVVVFLSCFVFYFSSTNAIKEEFNSKTILSSRIVSILDSKGLSDRKVFIIDGNAEFSPILKFTANIYPFLYDMVPKTFSGGYDGGRFMLMRSGLLGIYYADYELSQELIKKRDEISPLFKSD